MSEDKHEILQVVCADALQILRRVTEREEGEADLPPLEDTRSPFKPFWVNQSDCLLIHQSSKTSCLVSIFSSEGFLLHRLPTNHPTLFRWSAPCFVKIRGYGAGITFGYASASSFTVCMTPALREQLERTGTAPFGGLDAGVVCGPRLIESAEFAAAGAASYAALGAKVESGLMFNLSYAAGSLSVDVLKNGRVYGGDVTVADILEGRVPEPPELQPLYGDLAGIVHTVERVSAPSLTRSSLDRATLGEDPDRRGVVLDDGTVLK